MNKQGFVLYSNNTEYISKQIDYYCKDTNYENLLIIDGQNNTFLCNELLSMFSNINCLSVSFKEYANPSIQQTISQFNLDTLLVIVIDLYTMISNRLDTRLDAIQFRLHPKTKIVVDPFPYYVKPWQVYFPYSLLNKNWLQYNHSYAIEGEWNKYKDGTRSTNPCDEKLIVNAVKHCTFIDYENYFNQPEIVTQPVSYQIKKEYQYYKSKLFETENTPKSLVNKLDKFTQELCPWRSIPSDLKKIYKSDFRRIIKTDLKIDDYLLSEINGLITHTNNLTSGFYKEQNKNV